MTSLILSPPWPAAIALAMVLGIFWISFQIARRQPGGHEAHALHVAASFVLVTATVGAFVHALALFHLTTLPVLRILGGTLASASLGWVGRSMRTRIREALRWSLSRLIEASALERWVLLGSALAIICLGLGSLGPPTDIDTLAYHLSVPLDWLGHHGAYPTPDWLHSRLVGAGEALNLLGLAMGTDCLGAVFQMSGVLVAAAAMTCGAVVAGDGIFALAFVVACPLLPLLTLTDKPQLLPAAATSIALALILWHRQRRFVAMNAAILWMICGAVGFAVACKYSFLPAAAIISCVAARSLWRTPWFSRLMVIGPSAFVVIALPVFVRNFFFYGDPLSPVFEGFHSRVDPVVTTFSWYLRNFSGNHSLGHLVRLPFEMVVPTGPAQLTSVFGLGALAILLIPTFRRENWDVAAAAIALIVVTMAGGQLNARFLIDSYFWMGLAATAARPGRGKRLLFAGLALQLAIVVLIAGYGAVRLVPGALTSRQRHAVLGQYAADYALSEWLNRVLAEDAVVATDRRSSLFLERPQLHSDFAQMVDLSSMPEASKRMRILDSWKSHGVNTLVVSGPIASSVYAAVARDLGEPAMTSPVFQDAVRNPWKQGLDYTVAVFRVDAILAKERRE